LQAADVQQPTELSAFNPAGAPLVAMMGSVSRSKAMKEVFCFLDDDFIQRI